MSIVVFLNIPMISLLFFAVFLAQIIANSPSQKADRYDTLS